MGVVAAREAEGLGEELLRSRADATEGGVRWSNFFASLSTGTLSRHSSCPPSPVNPVAHLRAPITTDRRRRDGIQLLTSVISSSSPLTPSMCGASA